MFKLSEKLRNFIEGKVVNFVPCYAGVEENLLKMGACNPCTGCGNNCSGTCAGSCRGNCSGSCQRYSR